MLLSRTRTFLDMIKFEHTVFALPFAYLGMLLAGGQYGADGWPGWWKFVWITVAMAAARTAGMSLNRLIDRHIDARNPRTAGRPIQAGKISSNAVLVGALLSLGALAVAAWLLNPVAFFLFPGALVFLVGYAYTKRFTWLSHFILGFTDGLAPAGAWVAITGTFWRYADIPGWLLLFALTVWIGGFDLIYACQDVEVDRREGLHSVPARFGIAFALRLAQVCHALTVILLGAVGAWFGLGWPFWIGLAAIAALFVWEHSLVKPNDLSKVNMAFFNVNGYISLTILFATVVALIL
ncbi:MAG TPA: UbiA-like polyprenyltransferase [Anaerolineales bacterium]|nr:UbiA-like polyprenyltransferase [Anaerolineales bacterium]HLF02294.1 UbiA-like polyprenyltransferase [Anaerolineales bacterium]